MNLTHVADRDRAKEQLYSLGHWLITQARPRDAATIFHAMVLVAPRDERAWLGLGTCHEQVGQPGLALEMYATGRAVSLRGARCAIAAGLLLRDLGRDDDADDALDRASALADDDEELLALIHAARRST